MGPCVRRDDIEQDAIACCRQQKWPGLLPAIFISVSRSASPRRRDAGRGWRQRSLTAIEQRSDAPDRDAPVDAARTLRLLLQVLLAIALRGQVLGKHAEL